MNDAVKMKLTSLDVTAEKQADLKRCLGQAFPEVFANGSIDFDQLRRVLGKWVDPGKERFGLNWPGKAECMRIIQQPSVATLKPVREESVNFDQTGNIFIEGDNLEVLKLLQKAYFGKIKMIYIDPPYNTGNEFIYPDKYAETLETYLAYTGQLGEDRKKLSTNTDTSGRYHSRWLSMMYPRVYLARNLLREDGAIFVSCDDHEVHNLRELMNEIFGEENFIACVIWQKVYSPKNSAQHFSEDHDYILVYARQADVWRPFLLPRSEEMEARYDNPDKDQRGSWKPGDMSARNYYGEGTYPITCPSGRVIKGPPAGRYWVVSKEKFEELDRDGRIWWGKDGNNVPAIKRFLCEVKQGRVPQTLWPYAEVGHTQEAKKELLALVDFPNSDAVFETPKPTRLLRRILQLATAPGSDDIILDFFAGSGSLMEAMFAQNAEDGGNRRCILVQLPEPIVDMEGTISDMAKQRIRRAATRIAEAKGGQLALDGAVALDLGFKVLRLDRSNFNVWGSDTSDIDDLVTQIELHVEHLSKVSGAEDVLYELLLKAGFPLTTGIRTVEMAGERSSPSKRARCSFALRRRSLQS
jgi:adenine-specific DNA-methyltransferase